MHGYEDAKKAIAAALLAEVRRLRGEVGRLRELLGGEVSRNTTMLAPEYVEKLVETRIAEEREACAKVAEEMGPGKPGQGWDGAEAAAAIRARKT